MSEDKITAVITSCGRFKFLEKTITTLLDYSDEQFHEIIVIDNSTLPNSFQEIEKISYKVRFPFKILIGGLIMAKL